MYELYSRAAEEPGENFESKIGAAAVKLRAEARLSELQHGLELLSQRVYLSRIGFAEDTLPSILRGGGVDGNAIKRVTW